MLLRILLVLLVFVLPTGGLLAHSMPHSAIYVDVRDGRLIVDGILPVVELKYAVDRPIPARALSQSDRRYFVDYIQRHFAVIGRDGRPWPQSLSSLEMRFESGHADIYFTAILDPPNAEALRRFTVTDDLITHEVASHIIFLFIRHGAGLHDDQPSHLVGALQYPVRTIEVAGVDNVSGNAFYTAFKLGVRHILEGVDHLLFLFCLLIAAILRPERGGWGERRSQARALAHVGGVVTAFTIGHSMTLLVGSIWQITFPQPVVEILIAASILIAAINIWRPIFRGYEAMIAGMFGLIHGMAFSALITQYVSPYWSRAYVIIGFNLGIEVVQLFLVVIITPIIFMLASMQSFRWFRFVSAAGAGLAAIFWIAGRSIAI